MVSSRLLVSLHMSPGETLDMVDDLCGSSRVVLRRKGTNNEEQQWDQIFSLRAIVGYNETLQPSLREELMALYLFIGVEPPVYLKHATDIAEIIKNLQFLKSVVGVK
ncbi:hypothetical protein M5K25_008348 [Dendrobium thyrsiflorum]|uniref:Uncharacterized protein n=1 Tax=Dendrobium thyrsiflorum TaxID=117978 RepID=A0ABD0V7T0_DENTH